MITAGSAIGNIGFSCRDLYSQAATATQKQEAKQKLILNAIKLTGLAVTCLSFYAASLIKNSKYQASLVLLTVCIQPAVSMDIFISHMCIYTFCAGWTEFVKGLAMHRKTRKILFGIVAHAQEQAKNEGHRIYNSLERKWFRGLYPAETRERVKILCREFKENNIDLMKQVEADIFEAYDHTFKQGLPRLTQSVLLFGLDALAYRYSPPQFFWLDKHMEDLSKFLAARL